MDVTPHLLCPLCESAQWERFRFGLWRCESCGLVVSPHIWEAGINEAMKAEWFGEHYQTETSWWVGQFEQRNARRALQRLAAAGVSAGRLLEVGIGSGAVRVSATRAGFDAVGCDLSALIAERVHRRYGIPVHTGGVESIEGQAEFDVIVMNHVLEHTPDPTRFLRAAARLLKEEGILLIAVPNLGCWKARLPDWNSYEPYQLLVAHAYRLAMVASGAVTWALRRLQAMTGYGDELVMLARRLA